MAEECPGPRSRTAAGRGAPKSTSKESTASLRHADPKRDSGLLSDLTRLSETADALGRELGDESAPQLDRTIKDLASILIKHDASYHEVNGKLDAFLPGGGKLGFPHLRRPPPGPADSTRRRPDPHREGVTARAGDGSLLRVPGSVPTFPPFR